MNKTIMSRFVLLLSLSFLSACASGPKIPVVDLDKFDSIKRDAINNVAIFNPANLENKKFRVLNVVEGHSCQVLSGDPPVTRTRAIEQLKYFAYEMSGDGITNIKCAKEGTSLATNCWELISCTAEVVKFMKEQ